MTDRKEEIRKFLDAMVDGNSEQADVHFHNFVTDKMKNLVNPEVEVDDVSSEEDVTDED